jgi:hypothetical protein
MIALIAEALVAANARLLLLDIAVATVVPAVIPLRFKRIKAPHCLCDGDRRNAVAAVSDRRPSAVAAVADRGSYF